MPDQSVYPTAEPPEAQFHDKHDCQCGHADCPARRREYEDWKEANDEARATGN